MLDEDEDERRQQCFLCDEDSCRHLVGEGDSEGVTRLSPSIEWSGGLSDVPEVWALISQAQVDGHILKEIFADVPPWDEIEEDQAPEDFLSEHHPRVYVCSVFWDSGSPGANGYVYYVYMTEEDQAQASKDLRRLQELILNPPSFAEAAKRSRDRDQYSVVAEMATDPVDRAYALAKLGLFVDAMSCCEEALRKSPRNERAWYNLACYCARLRRKDDCMFALKQAIYLNHESGKMAAADIDFDEFWSHRDFGKLVRQRKPLTPRDLEPGRGVALDLLPVPRAIEEWQNQFPDDARFEATAAWEAEILLEFGDPREDSETTNDVGRTKWKVGDIGPLDRTVDQSDVYAELTPAQMQNVSYPVIWGEQDMHHVHEHPYGRGYRPERSTLCGLRLPTRYYVNNHAVEFFKERPADICKVCGERVRALLAWRTMQQPSSVAMRASILRDRWRRGLTGPRWRLGPFK